MLGLPQLAILSALRGVHSAHRAEFQRYCMAMFNIRTVGQVSVTVDRLIKKGWVQQVGDKLTYTKRKDCEAAIAEATSLINIVTRDPKGD